ncbi:MAG: putative transcriptional regulator, TetR family protein [Actinomycetia bacterium]|jgi:AcrR family transcriptional regulator|nr:putative transcriptional regulator, TetR family protein [Actinomycetes bacterium]
MEQAGSTRRYDSRGRQAQARRNRETVLDIARRRFLADGYAATTIAAIAKGAEVSVETVYKAFGGKAGLVRAIYEQSLAGAGPIPAPQRSDEMQNRETDPATIVRGWGILSTEVAPVVSPIHLLIRAAAATDPDMAVLLHDSDRQRRERMRHNARTLADRGHLRTGLTLDQATDILWTYSSPELFELLVLRCGWDLPRYGRFLSDAMIGALLPSTSVRIPAAPDDSA